MIIVWFVTKFDAYLLVFLVNTFEKEYLASLGYSIATISSQILGAFLFDWFALKVNYIGAFILSLIGGLLVWLWGLKNESSNLIFVLVLIASFGTYVAFQLIYLGHTKIFPTQFASASMGFCQVCAGMIGSFSPFISSIDEPVPIIVYSASVAVALFLTFFLRVDERKKEEDIEQEQE